MAVYVDDMNLPATVQNGPRVSHTSEWSHLFADTEEELHAFAARLGLRRSYFQQGKPDWFPHYDVTKGKRWQALRLGARPVSAYESATIARERNARPAEPEADAKARRILVTGSRTWDDEAAVRAALAPHYAPGAVLVSGACPEGADAIAERIWAGWGGTVERHPADWAKHGRAAGAIRNGQMARLPGITECLAFADRCTDTGCRVKGEHATHGTADMRHKAAAAGIPVIPVSRAGCEHQAAAAARGTPAPLTAADRRRMADEYALDAGRAWKAGDVVKAARLVRVAAELDPSRPELWTSRQQQIQDRAARMPLAAQTAARLAAAGVTQDDPAYQRLREHNRLRREAQAETTGPQADGDPEAA